MENLSNRIKITRQFRNVSQMELAKKIGVSRHAVSRWEKGEMTPSIDKAIRIASVLNVSLDDIFLPKRAANSLH